MAKANTCRISLQYTPAYEFILYPTQVKSFQHKIVAKDNVDSLASPDVNDFSRQRRFASACTSDKFNLHLINPC